MTVPRLAVFGLVLAAALAGGAALGAVIGPEPAATKPVMAHAGDGDVARSEPDAGVGVKGLAVSEAGYTLEAEQTVVPEGTAPFRFHIVGPDGTPVRRYAVEHDKQLHLIAVSRDLGYYAHVHPTLDRDGTWSVTLDSLRPGPHRVFADFTASGGRHLTLGVDVTVPGDYQPPAAMAAARRTTVDGLDVSLLGTPSPGQSGMVTVAVTKAGAPVALERYLGAAGHLVAIRAGDLAYLHVHPMQADATKGSVPFGVEVPSAGRYHVFFDFQVAGGVHTAAFVLDVQGTHA